ncbi:MAG: hypothetical protein QOH56_2800 [Pseudonocardiales bacterium]|jgi:uncharacterized protein (DUF433 family)|nr:hypothetical protein [Pseudonocardiales bacterium]
MSDVAESVISVPRDRAARLTGLSNRQLAYWAQRDIASPTIEGRVTDHRIVRLYDFRDLMSLLVAVRLRDQGISLQHIRRVVQRLKESGYDQPLTQLRFATLGKSIYFQHDDGSWEGDPRPDQIVIHQVLDLEPLRTQIRIGIRRREEDAGKIDRRRGALGSKAVFAGTRVPVETVVRYLHAGRSAEEIIESFPALTTADVEAARQLVAA